MVIKKNERILLIILSIILLFNFVFINNVQAVGITAISAATLAKFILLSGAAALGIYGVSKTDLSSFIDDFLTGSKYLDDKFIGPFSAWIYGKFVDAHGKVYQADAKVTTLVQNMLNDFTNYVKQQIVVPRTIAKNTKIDENGNKYVENDGEIKYTTDIYTMLSKLQANEVIADYVINLNDLNIKYTDIITNINYITILGTTVNCKVNARGSYYYDVNTEYAWADLQRDLSYQYKFTKEGYIVGGFAEHSYREDFITGMRLEQLSPFMAVAEIFDLREYLSSGKKIKYNENILLNEKSSLFNIKTAELAAPNANNMPIIGVMPKDLGKTISHEESISISDVIQGAVVSDTYSVRVSEYAKNVDYPVAPVIWKDITNDDVLERIAALEGELADYKTLPKELVITPDIEIIKEFERQLADIKAQSVPENDLELGDNKINWDILKNIKIPQKFPFSIPWDIYKIIAVLQVPKERPVFNFAIKDYQFKLDLGKYEEITKVTRFFVSLIWLGVMYTSFKRFKGD